MGLCRRYHLLSTLDTLPESMKQVKNLRKLHLPLHKLSFSKSVPVGQNNEREFICAIIGFPISCFASAAPIIELVFMQWIMSKSSSLLSPTKSFLVDLENAKERFRLLVTPQGFSPVSNLRYILTPSLISNPSSPGNFDVRTDTSTPFFANALARYSADISPPPKIFGGKYSETRRTFIYENTSQYTIVETKPF